MYEQTCWIEDKLINESILNHQHHNLGRFSVSGMVEMSLFLLFLRPWTNPLNTLSMEGKGGGEATKNKTGPHFWKNQCSLTSPRLTFLPPHNYQPSGSPWLHLPLWVRAHNSVSNGVDMRRLTLGRGRWRGGQDITPSAFKEAVRAAVLLLCLPCSFLSLGR